jgi:hypothetical protein
MYYRLYDLPSVCKPLPSRWHGPLVYSTDEPIFRQPRLLGVRLVLPVVEAGSTFYARVVVSGAVVVEAGFRVEVPARVPERIADAARRIRRVAERIESICLRERAGRFVNDVTEPKPSCS